MFVLSDYSDFPAVQTVAWTIPLPSLSEFLNFHISLQLCFPKKLSSISWVGKAFILLSLLLSLSFLNFFICYWSQLTCTKFSQYTKFVNIKLKYFSCGITKMRKLQNICTYLNDHISSSSEGTKKTDM